MRSSAGKECAAGFAQAVCEIGFGAESMCNMAA
jgi:hypothetical protein